MSNTYAIVKDNIIVNVVAWDGESEYTPDGEVVLIPEDVYTGIGASYSDGVFGEPPQVEVIRED